MRVGVVRNRLTMFKRFHAATKMQSLVRMFLEGRVCSLARQSLRNKREILANNRLAEMMLQEEARLEREKFEAQVARDIFYQAANGHAAVVDRLFNDRSFSTHSSELDVNEDGETVLLVAARRGFVEIVRRCVWWGFDLNHRNKDDETAVMLAAKNGHEDVVSFLLEMPLNSGKDRTNRAKRLLIKKEDTALMTTSAARLGKSRILKRICEYEGPSRLDSKLPSTGETALHIACELNRIEEIRYLVSQKCSISAPDDHDVTPLMRASASSNQAARIVLGLSEEDSMWLNTLDKETASMVRQRDKDGRDCYIYAALNAQQNTLDMFSKLVPRLHPYNLLGTSDDGHDEVKIRPLVIWRADDCDKVASLIENGCVQCLSRLLEEGFNSNMLQGGSGRSLVSYACEFGQLEALDLLMTRAVNPLDSRGVSLSQVDEAGRNALHYAARCCHQSVIEYVLSHPCAAKCKVDSKLLIALDINGDSALHIAGRHGAHIPLSALTTDEWILGLSVRNNSGMTPLLEACAAQHAAVALHLIKLGADVLAVDSDGRSTLWHLVRPRGGQTDKRDLGLTVLSLLQGGCALYTNEQTHVYDASALRIEDSSEPGDFIIDSVDGPTLAGCRDLIAGESSLLWRLLLSALKFDRISSYALRAILDKGTVALIGSSLYQGLSLLGWATVLDSRPAVDFLMSYAGIRLDTAVDEDGNTAVHLASRHDLSELLDIMLIKGGGHLAKGVDIPNKLGVTPAVVGAKHGSMRAVKLLHHKYGASARTALDGRYWAWLLALAMKEVRREKKFEARDENEQLRLPIR
jgi:ankyrin repeat protein